ncbi:MAG TPA: lasso RiPP family leader peptide-containing protein [Methylococcales bacterium]
MKSNKKTYTKPQLVVHGNVEEITLKKEENKYRGGPHSGMRRGERDDD